MEKNADIKLDDQVNGLDVTSHMAGPRSSNFRGEIAFPFNLFDTPSFIGTVLERNLAIRNAFGFSQNEAFGVVVLADALTSQGMSFEEAIHSPEILYYVEQVRQQQIQDIEDSTIKKISDWRKARLPEPMIYDRLLTRGMEHLYFSPEDSASAAKAGSAKRFDDLEEGQRIILETFLERSTVGITEISKTELRDVFDLHGWFDNPELSQTASEGRFTRRLKEVAEPRSRGVYALRSKFVRMIRDEKINRMIKAENGQTMKEKSENFIKGIQLDAESKKIPAA